MLAVRAHAATDENSGNVSAMLNDIADEEDDIDNEDGGPEDPMQSQLLMFKEAMAEQASKDAETQPEEMQAQLEPDDEKQTKGKGENHTEGSDQRHAELIVEQLGLNDRLMTTATNAWKGMGSEDSRRSEKAKQIDIDEIINQRVPQRRPYQNEHMVSTNGLVKHKWFRHFVGACVMLNSIQLGVCVKTDGQAEESQRVCKIMEVAFAVIFFAEMVVKLFQYRCDYFKFAWNWIDLALVLFSIVDVTIEQMTFDCTHCASVMAMRTARILRALRLFRMLQMRRELVVLVEGLFSSLRAMLWIAVLLGVLIYASAIFAVSALGSHEEHEEIGWAYPYFETLPQASLTLFNLAILDEWADVMRPLFEVYPLFVLFFIAYVFVGAFGVLNLIIGVITESTTTAAFEFERAKENKERARRMDQIVALSDAIFKACHGDGNGTMTVEEFSKASEEACNELLMDVELPLGFAVADLYLMVSPELAMSKDDFTIAMARIVFCDQFERDCVFQHSINDLRREFKALHGKHAHTNDNFGGIMDEMTAMRTELKQEMINMRLSLELHGVPMGYPPSSVRGKATTTDTQFMSKESTRTDVVDDWPEGETPSWWLQSHAPEMRRKLADPVGTRLKPSIVPWQQTVVEGVAMPVDACTAQAETLARLEQQTLLQYVPPTPGTDARYIVPPTNVGSTFARDILKADIPKANGVAIPSTPRSPSAMSALRELPPILSTVVTRPGQFDVDVDQPRAKPEPSASQPSASRNICHM